MIEYSQFQRPQRYIGNEWNVVKKSHQDKITICLSYPEDYEIGMSNVGLRIVYGMLNEYRDVACERVFMPALDLQEYLKRNSEKLFSLESKLPLNQFDVIGFNLDYELNVLNMLSILSLGGIEVNSSDRKEHIVIAGGVANPEPFAQFVDVFYLGEFEEGAEDFVETLRRHKSKRERLIALSQVEGFYVPAFYDAQIEAHGYTIRAREANVQFPLKRVFVKNLDTAYYPRKWLVPHTSIVHDRIPIEIARGCPHACSFCQARALYYPYRERKVATVRSLVEEMYEATGYENISFLSLSAADYSSMEGLIDEALDYCKPRNIGISLPSLRVDDVIGGFYKKLVSLKTISLTLAVEAARNELRDSMNKRIDIAKLFEAAKIIRGLHIRHLKIYFMFGFLQERDEDLLAIGAFLTNLSQQAQIALNASINIFIPKPFSQWENEPMQSLPVLKQKRETIIKGLPRSHGIKINISKPEQSVLEGIFSRADRNFSQVIYQAYVRGLSLDNQSIDTTWSAWEELMQVQGIDYHNYLSQPSHNLPWSFIKAAC